jgi:hypothetical protein
VFSAIVPDLVPRSQLASALALNGVAMNLSRIVGPLVAGALIASAGSVWVFALNAVLSVLSGFVVLRWRYTHPAQPLGQERLISAMRVGVQFVRQSPRLLAVLLRVSIFFFHSLALIGLCRCSPRACTAATRAPSRCCSRAWARARSSPCCCCRGCARRSAATASSSAARSCSRRRPR